MSPPQAQSDGMALLLGPTGTGKSELGVALAELLGAEIVSLDSMLVYRGMDVGTAKPGPDLRARVPHHCLDLVAPPERYDLTRYLADAAQAAEVARARGRRVLYVGGTALYAKALLAGVFEGPAHDPELRAELNARGERLGSPALHAELALVDPDSAARLHPNDLKRVVRALEVLRASGRPLSEWQREWRHGDGSRAPLAAHRMAVLTLEPKLYERRLAARAALMLASGWIEEVERIQADGGFGPTSIQALGYRDVLAHIRGELSRAELTARVVLQTRQFARRQRTWLRQFSGALAVDGAATDALSAVARHFTGE